MADLFADYELMAQSGLFDAAYYLNANPDVSALGIDPLIHYLESGALELRNPSEAFDARYYAQKCRERGQSIDNPLLHYIRYGALQGMALRPDDEPVAASDVPAASKPQYFCDVIEVTTGGRVSITGWAVAAAAMESISVALDGQEIGHAELHLDRPDVGEQFPNYAHARTAGFVFRERVSQLAEGSHVLALRLRAGSTRTEVLLPIVAVANDEPEPAQASDLLFSIDTPKVVDGSAVTPIRGNLEIGGWAISRAGPPTLEITVDGELLKSVDTGMHRSDVQRAFPDWDGALTSGFSALLPHRSLPVGKHRIAIVARDNKGQNARSEFWIDVEEVPDSGGPWALRRRMTAAEINLLRAPLKGLARPPLFAILLLVGSGSKSMDPLNKTWNSLESQAYANWHLYVLGRARSLVRARSGLPTGQQSGANKVTFIAEDSKSTRLVGEDGPMSHVMVLLPGDELGCDALLEFAVHSSAHPNADLFYCDDRRHHHTSGKIEAFFKPQWSPDLMLSMNYLGRAWCARTSVFRRSTIRRSELLSASSYDVALRLTECAEGIHHVAATLMEESHGIEESRDSERKALQNTLTRRGIKAVIEPGRTQSTFRVRRAAATKDLVSIVIPTCAAGDLIRTCVESLRDLTAYRNHEIVCIENIPETRRDSKSWLRANVDRVVAIDEPFNWSRYNNLAVKQARGRYLLFLNDDIEVVEPAWLDALLEHAARPEVGAVGAQLLYPDQRVQHAGMFLAGLGVARHAFRYAAADDPGYFGLALAQRNVIAVTGACLMTRRETFETLGGFDEGHDVVNNDVDYCLRVWRHGLRTIYTPHAQLIHHELVSRSQIAETYDKAAFLSKWRSAFVSGDPYFSARLSMDRDDYSFEWEATGVHCVGNPVLQHDSVRQILVVKLDHIGDCIIAFPAIRRLKRHFPQARITVLTSRASKAIWALEPAVEECIEFDFFAARSSLGIVDRTEEDWQALSTTLAPYQFDLAVDLRKHWESRPVLQHTGARYLAGFDTRNKFPWLDVAVEWAEDQALMNKRQHAADDLINLVDAIASASDVDRRMIALPDEGAAPTSISAAISRDIFRKRVVCVHPGVGNEMRQWPLEHFALLVDQLIETADVHVILIGGADETALGTRILESIANPKSVWSLIGRIALRDLPGILKRCSLFVGNNSGPQHIAAGLGVPTVGIHSGVVDAREWGPKGDQAVAIQRAMTCAPCYRSKLSDCSRGLACLHGLRPSDVMQVCYRLLAPKAVSAGAERKPRGSTDSQAAVI